LSKTGAPRRWSSVGIVLVLVGSAACSTTTKKGPVDIGNSTSATTTAGGSASGSSATGSGGGPAPASSGGTHGGGAAGTTPSGGAVPAPGTPGGAAPVAIGGHKICNGTVEFGISYGADTGPAVAAASGRSISSQTPAGLEAGFQHGIDFLNAHGGWGGCVVKPVFFGFKYAGDFDQQSQEECTTFTRDHHVFAALNTFTDETQTYMQCMADRKVPMVWGGNLVQPYGPTYTRYHGYLYQPWAISFDRWGPFIDELNSVGFFHPGAKAGILIADNGTGDDAFLANSVWTPKLNALKVPVSTFTFTQIRSLSDISNVSTQMSSAVLRFRQQGVTNVLFTPSAAIATLEFGNQAQSQGYHPYYETNSLEGPGLLPDGEKPRATHVGWLPVSDDNPPSKPLSNPANPALQQCDDIYKTASQGQSVPTYDTILFCDAMFFVQQALAKAPAMTAAGLLAGVDALGQSFDTAAGYGPTRLGNGRYDGNTMIRSMKWDASAKVFKYVSPPRPVP
jgi:hypothetical protein